MRFPVLLLLFTSWSHLVSSTTAQEDNDNLQSQLQTQLAECQSSLASERDSARIKYEALEQSTRQEKDRLSEHVRALEAQLEQFQTLATEKEHSAAQKLEQTQKELQESFQKQLGEQETRFQQAVNDKNQLAEHRASLETTLETTRQDLLQLKRELVSEKETVARLEKEKLYYWELLESVQEQIQTWYQTAVTFVQTNPRIQQTRGQVHDAVQPHWDQLAQAASPHWQVVKESTAPARHQVHATWQTKVQPVLQEQRAIAMALFGKATAKVSDWAVLHDAPPAIQKALHRLAQHSRAVWEYSELVLGVYLTLRLLGWLFLGNKKKANKKAKKVKVSKNKKLQ